ncbi:MAG: translation elongation factor Ts [Candidatus Faecisoma sp.]|nr:translation elongation factor Ts [Candidatus Faecisoma sp.]CCY27899.1 elongation factor Ts [Acholeplasma sp. CAG:878]
MSASLVKELRELTGAGMLDCKKALEACNGNIDDAIAWLREKGISKAAKKADRIAAEGLADILIEGNKAVIVEVNSETDFVAKNQEFKDLVKAILKAIIENEPKTNEDVLNLVVDGETVNDLIVNKTAKIGEKLSFRRFSKIEKNDEQVFGSYIHMGGKIAVLTRLNGANEEVAKDVAMHAAAMRPSVVRREQVPQEEVEKEREILKEQAINEGKPAEIAEKMVEGRLAKFFKEVCLEEQPFVKDGDINVLTYVKNNNGTIEDMVRFEVGEGMEKREENFAEEVAKQMGK